MMTTTESNKDSTAAISPPPVNLVEAVIHRAKGGDSQSTDKTDGNRASHSARLRGTADHLQAVATAFKQHDTWTIRDLRTALGERYVADAGSRTFVLLGFADRVSPGKYRLTSLGREYVTAANRTNRAKSLREALLESIDFRPYWNAVARRYQLVGNKEIAELLMENFGFPQWSARNYASELIHYGTRAGLFSREIGPSGRYLVRSTSEPASVQAEETDDDIESLTGLVRQLDRIIIRLGKFLASDRDLGDRELRMEFAQDLSRLPSDMVPNGNRELLDICKEQARLVMDKPDIGHVQVLYRHLEYLSRRLIHDVSKDRPMTQR